MHLGGYILKQKTHFCPDNTPLIRKNRLRFCFVIIHIGLCRILMNADIRAAAKYWINPARV